MCIRDRYQLVTDHVHVVSTRKGLSDIAVMTPESVDDLYLSLIHI